MASFFANASNVRINGGDFSVIHGNLATSHNAEGVVNVHSYNLNSYIIHNEYFNSKVTIARLYPELEKLLHNVVTAPQIPTLPQKLIGALREHVFNAMPLRLIQLPQMRLVERNEVVGHIATKMAVNGITDELLSKMEAMVDTLGREYQDASTQRVVDLEEHDAREDKWDAVCQFLFIKFALYAILSHTWLQIDRDSEIEYRHTLQDNWPGSISENPDFKAGYEKLKGFCDVAYNEHSVTLAWIDTLCINKDSSAELDESIQSMYKWYQNSSICITYLRETTSLDNMAKDKWFQRGWTLQELIAPKKMQFYRSDWSRLTPYTDGNDKADPKMQDILCKATGIPPTELVAFDALVGSDVATRMSWAALRMTTRGEDQAYSLMGIFGVNFPISYGEGAERAFFRLIESIISSRHASHIIQTLNWAGKSISDAIHTSRLIPSRPACYRLNVFRVQDAARVNQEQDNTSLEHESPSTFFPTHSEPMFLTHVGLRVKLLLVSAHLVGLKKLYQHQQYGPFDITMTLAFSASSFKDITALLLKPFSEVPQKDVYPTRMATPFGINFFLGIYTFKEDNHYESIQIPLTSFAFILHIPKPYERFKIHDLREDHFEPAAKIDTRRVVHAQRIRHESAATQSMTPDVQSKSFDTISKRDLSAMDMKVLHVYL